MFWSVAWADGPVVGGTVKPTVWADLVPGDFEDEDVVEVDTWARLFANGELPSRDRWFVEARLQHHALFGPSDTGTPTEGWWELQLGDTGWNGKVAGPVRLRTGALVETWGTMNLLPVSDVLNARDFRNGLRQDTAFQKLSAPMAVLAVEDHGVRFETTWVPFPVYDRMWLRDTDWSYVRPGFTEGLLSDASGFAISGGDSAATIANVMLTNASHSIGDLAPQNRRNLDQSFTTSSVPEALFFNGDVAERMRISGPRGSVVLTGGWLRSRQPLSALSPVFEGLFRTQVNSLTTQDLSTFSEDGVLQVEWPRTALAGLEGATLAGPFQLRLDSMFKTKQVVRRWYGQSATSPWLGAGAGLDWAHGSAWQVTLEARWQHLFEPPSELMFSLPDQVQVAGGVRWTTARDRIVAQLGGVFDATFLEGFVRPSLTWRARDHVQLELLANVIAGSTAPAAGFLAGPLVTPDALSPAERRLLAFRYAGGPLSYFQQNDEIGLSVTFQR